MTKVNPQPFHNKTPLETAVGKQMLLIDVDQLPPFTVEKRGKAK